MPDQLALPGLDVDEPRLYTPVALPGLKGRLIGYNLFLALFPDPPVAERAIAPLAAQLRLQHGLGGACLRADRFHVTLHKLAFFTHAIPLSIIEAARAASGGVPCAPLPLVFDRAGSFVNKGEPGNNAFVLRCDARSDAAVAELRERLKVRLKGAGLHPQASSQPHITLLYDPRIVDPHPIEPLGWTASRFSLILSHQGLGHHEPLGQWQLR